MLSMACWLGMDDFQCHAQLHWERSPVVQPKQKVAQSTYSRTTLRVRRDYQVMAAAWEQEDARDSLGLPTPEDDLGLPTHDPFDEDDRWAQLPDDDPFDEPVEEFEESSGDLEDSEEQQEQPEEEAGEGDSVDSDQAIADEFERRRKDRDLSDAELQKRLLESDPLEDKGVDEFNPFSDPEDWIGEAKDETDNRLQTNGEERGGYKPDERLSDPDYTVPELDRGFLEEQLEKERIENDKNCEEEFTKLRNDSIRDIDLNINLEGNPGEDFPFECKIGRRQLAPRQWPLLTYNWKASALCHKPLYFEQVQLERYGHSWGPFTQPIMSGVHFFSSVPILPYKMGVRTPRECVYTLGHYRPGNCAPYMIEPMPLSLRGALFQAGAITGVSVVVP